MKKIDIESLTKTPYINVDLILDSTEQIEKERTITDQLIENLHSNTNKFYIEPDKKTNAFTVKELKKKELRRHEEIWWDWIRIGQYWNKTNKKIYLNL